MSLIKDIKTITKTDEIKRKLDKLSVGKIPEAKTAIQGYRSASYQTGNGSKGVGSTGNGPPVNGVDGAGAVVAPSQSTAGSAGPNTNPNTTTTNFTDVGLSFGTTMGFGSTSGGLSGTSGSNMAGNVSSSGNTASIRPVAQEGVNDSDLQDVLTAIDGLAGYSTEQKNKMKEEYTRKYLKEEYGIQDGVFTARDLADERSYAPRAENYHSILSTETSIMTLDPSKKIRGVIGFDIDGETTADGAVKAVYVHLDKTLGYVAALNFPIPTGWDDADSPPILDSYFSGRTWSLTWSGTQLFANSFEGLLEEVNNFTGQDLTAYGGDTNSSSTAVVINKPAKFTDESVLFSLNDTGVIGTDIDTLGGTFYSEIVGVVASISAGQIGSIPCGSVPGTGPSCSAPPPTQDAWPLEGAYVLSYLNGKFISNAYDSLVPLKWKEVVSTVDVALGDGVNIVDDRKMTIEQGYAGGTIISFKEANDDFIHAILLDANGVPLDKTDAESNVNYWRPL